MRHTSLIAATAVLTVVAFADVGAQDWQVNQSGSQLDVDGQVGTGTDPLQATRCLGETAVVNFNSALAGMPWDLGMTLGPGVPASAGGGVSAAGQIVNLDMVNPTLSFLLDQNYVMPFAPFSLTLPIPVEFWATCQLGVFDPAHADGIQISGCAGVRWVSAQSVAGPTTDDGSVLMDLSTSPFCLGNQVTFDGISYSTFYVNANGSVSFGQSVSDATPSASEFASGPPRIAALWGDLDPSAGGEIAVTETTTSVVVSFTSLPEAGQATASSVSIEFTLGTGFLRIFSYAPDAAFTGDALIGATPGNGALDPGSVPFSGLAPQAIQINPFGPAGMIYELSLGGAPGAFNELVFPVGNTSLFFVN